MLNDVADSRSLQFVPATPIAVPITHDNRMTNSPATPRPPNEPPMSAHWLDSAPNENMNSTGIAIKLL